MDKLKLILPRSGTTNWGNAINHNFIQLLREQRNLSSRIDTIEVQLETDDGINLSAEKFVLLTVEDDEVVGYLEDIMNWDNSGVWQMTTPFQPGDANHMDGYAVKIDTRLDGINTLVFWGVNFLTNDILYVTKDTLNRSVVVRRWASSIGGYYEPAQWKVENDGTMKLRFTQKPALMLGNDEQVWVDSHVLDSPYIVTQHIECEGGETQLVSNVIWYNSAYVYDVQLYYKVTNERFLAAYSLSSAPSGYLIINFNSPLPENCYCNIVAFTSEDTPEPSRVELIVDTDINQSISLNLGSISQPVTVNWGDGTSDTYPAGNTRDANTVVAQHTYVPLSKVRLSISGIDSVPDNFAQNQSNVTSFLCLSTGLNLSIGARAFENCTNLRYVQFGKNVTQIKTDAFNNCGKIAKVYYNGTGEQWGTIIFHSNNANPIFYNENKETQLYIISGNQPQLLETLLFTDETLQAHAYDGCRTLKEIRFTANSTINNFPEYIFAHCDALEKIVIPYDDSSDEFPTIKEYAFYDVPLTAEVYFMSDDATNWDDAKIAQGNNTFKTLTRYYYSATYPDQIGGYNIWHLDNDNNIQFWITDGLAYVEGFNDDYHLIGIGDCSYDNIFVPEVYNDLPVTRIKASAFRNNTKLESIIIPDSVTTIEYYVFFGCTGLKRVDMPNSLTSIGLEMFRGCTALTTVNIPNAATSIQNAAFLGCTQLDNITIPDSVETIASSAFKVCTGLQNVTIGNGIKNINQDAFYGCTSLGNITYNGTKAKWAMVNRGSGWHYNVPATVVHCSDGDVSLDYIG